MSELSASGILDRYLLDHLAEETRDNSLFRSSDMGTCYLKRFWKRQGKEGDLPDTLALRKFAMGHSIHEFLQGVFEKTGFLVAKEGTVEFPNLMTGHFDMLFQLPDGHFRLYDIKSVHSKKFHYLDQFKRVNGFYQADPHHIRQIHTYCKGIRERGYSLFYDAEGNQVSDERKDQPGVIRKDFDPIPNLVDCWMLYVSKDDFVMREVSVPFTDKSEAAIEQEVKKLTEMWDGQQEPKAMPEMDWECQYCPFKGICPMGQEVVKVKEQEKLRTARL